MNEQSELFFAIEFTPGKDTVRIVELTTIYLLHKLSQ